MSVRAGAGRRRGRTSPEFRGVISGCIRRRALRPIFRKRARERQAQRRGQRDGSERLSVERVHPSRFGGWRDPIKAKRCYRPLRFYVLSGHIMPRRPATHTDRIEASCNSFGKAHPPYRSDARVQSAGSSLPTHPPGGRGHPGQTPTAISAIVLSTSSGLAKIGRRPREAGSCSSKATSCATPWKIRSGRSACWQTSSSARKPSLGAFACSRPTARSPTTPCLRAWWWCGATARSYRPVTAGTGCRRPIIWSLHSEGVPRTSRPGGLGYKVVAAMMDDSTVSWELIQPRDHAADGDRRRAGDEDGGDPAVACKERAMMMSSRAPAGARCALVVLSLFAFVCLEATPSPGAPLASAFGPEVALAEPQDGFVGSLRVTPENGRPDALSVTAGSAAQPGIPAGLAHRQGQLEGGGRRIPWPRIRRSPMRLPGSNPMRPVNLTANSSRRRIRLRHDIVLQQPDRMSARPASRST